MVWLLENPPKYAMLLPLIVDHSFILYGPAQAAYSPSNLNFSAHVEVCAFPPLQHLGLAEMGLCTSLFYFEGRDCSSFMPFSGQCSAECLAGPAHVHWIILNWVGFAKATELTREERLEF